MTTQSLDHTQEVARIARRLDEKQREFLLRYDATTDKQAVPTYMDVCPCEFFVELEPEVWKDGCLMHPGQKAWFARGGSRSPAGSTEWVDSYIAYNPLGLSLRKHLQEQPHAK